MNTKCLLAPLVVLLCAPALVQAQVPLALALDAIQAARLSCEAKGYRISASAVDLSGVERAYIRGDGATVHTHETAFKKAYTVVTAGPIFQATTSGQLTEKISKTPSGPALSTISNVLLLAGGVALQSGGVIIGALGVGGAPGGALDEACAQDGVAAVQARLDALAPSSARQR